MVNLQKFGYSSQFEFDNEGKLYNNKTGNYLKLSDDNCYYLKLNNGKRVKRSINTLFKQAFNNNFICDEIEDLQNEIWKQIIFAKGYYISNKGRVKSYKQNKAILLKPQLTRKNKGYLRVQLYIDGIGYHYLVHRLVAYFFIENTPKKQELANHQIHHKNLISTDNRVQNLVWLTKQEHRQIHRRVKQEDVQSNESD